MAALNPGETSLQPEEAWRQVCDLSPRLASHVDTSRHSYRGEEWLVLSDRITGAHFRCGLEIEKFLSALDGKRTVDEAYQAAGGDANRFEILLLLAELQSSQLLLDLAPQDSSALFERQQALRRRRWLKRLASPLAIQVPLLDPDTSLARAAKWLTPLFRPLTFWIWLALVSFCSMIALDQWQALGLHWQSRFMDPGNLLLLWLCFPVVKGLHELGHGLATRVWGGEVHEMGVMLLVFTPVPYVDASASTAFQDRFQRMVVAAAGIMVELLLSAAALLTWLYCEPGLLRDMCFNIMVIGGLSTLLFNGNPLLRFDGYYVLCDLLEMPNLRSRANDCLGALLKRRLYDLQPQVAETTGGRERAWLLSYALLSGAYRLLISLTIALFIAGKYFFIGAALAFMLIINQMLLPMTRILTALWQQATREHKQGRFGIVNGAFALVSLLLLFVVPIDNSTQAEGIVKLPENTEMRARADGFVDAVAKRDGEPVQAGEVLMILSNPDLLAEEAAFAARAAELAVRYNEALSGERVELELIKRELDANADELREIREQLDNLQVRSPASGILALPRAEDLPGRFLLKGDLIGNVVSQATPSVQVVLTQDDVDRVSRRTREIQIRLASRLREVIPGEQIRNLPKASTELPSALLGSSAGGDIPVDARENEGRRATRPVFQLEVELPARDNGPYLGQRAYVRFEHYREPLGSVWIGKIRQKFVTQLGI